MLPRDRQREAITAALRYFAVLILGSAGCVALSLLRHFSALGFGGKDNACVREDWVHAWCYCEGTRLMFGSVVVYQPTNSFTSLFFCVGGGLVASIFLYRRFPSSKFLGLVDAEDVIFPLEEDVRVPNEFERGDLRAWCYVLSLASIGSMSWAFHALQDETGGVWDMISMDLFMVCVFATDAAQTVGRTWPKAGNWTFFGIVLPAGFVVVYVRLRGLANATVGVDGMFILVMCIVLAALVARLVYERWRDAAWSRDISLLAIALVAMVIAYAFRFTGCDPRSPWQGHGAWHFFAAVASTFLVSSHATFQAGFWTIDRMFAVRIFRKISSWCVRGAAKL